MKLCEREIIVSEWEEQIVLGKKEEIRKFSVQIHGFSSRFSEVSLNTLTVLTYNVGHSFILVRQFLLERLRTIQPDQDSHT